MKTNLNFEAIETKKLLSQFDFGYFLQENIRKEKYNQSDIDIIYSSYNETLKYLKEMSKVNRKQFNYYTEGYVRKAFTGGYLPAHFQLDESRRHVIGRFDDVGEVWAYFQYWQKYQKRKISKEKVWDYTVKLGSILAITLSIIKLLETIK